MLVPPAVWAPWQPVHFPGPWFFPCVIPGRPREGPAVESKAPFSGVESRAAVTSTAGSCSHCCPQGVPGSFSCIPWLCHAFRRRCLSLPYGLRVLSPGPCLLTWQPQHLPHGRCSKPVCVTRLGARPPQAVTTRTRDAAPTSRQLRARLGGPPDRV